MKGFSCLVLCSLVVFGIFGVCHGGLQMNFYEASCPEAESIVNEITRENAKLNPALGAKLLRLHFHDCFVRGCDASILLDSTDGNPSEKESPPNLTVEGYDLIDKIKTRLEDICNATVSCADIVALAARDAVTFPFRLPAWRVLTGRRDGRVSNVSEPLANLPPPFADFNRLQQMFNAKGLDTTDLVALSGGHTLGKAHCGTFSNRLYNFTGKGDADPSLDSKYADWLRSQCPNPANPQTTVEMDPFGLPLFKFDSHYYITVKEKRGLFQSDAALLNDGKAAELVGKFRNPALFFAQFAASMEKMAAIGVLTGDQDGEIRKNCRVLNSHS